jgi:DNA polymerase-3 subunit epsilon
MDKKLYFDIESSDLPIHTARIITISFLYGDKQTTLYINPEVPINPNASRVNGIYDRDVKNWKPFNHYAERIYKLLNECDTYVTYNGKSFDIPLLYVELLRCGYEMPKKPHIDVYEMVQSLFKSLKLKDIYTTLTKKTFDAHKSIEDIIATQELYHFIIENYLKE